MIEKAAVTLGGDETERDPDGDREEHGRKSQLHSRGEPQLDLLDDRLAGVGARAEVEAAGLLDEAPVLLVDRLVEPVLPLDLRDLLSGRALSEEGLGGPARQGPDPQEHEDREPDQDRDEKQEPADDESEHGASAGAVAGFSGREKQAG